ncbi:hypothetical protein [Ilumatobacter sp.]|uniref:hypothetical protein n=1 Tax=Ilumatobacter sp. TaxID=1967498 RepID=UPI003B52EF09
MTRRSPTAIVVALCAVAAIAGCASDEESSTVDRWFGVTRDIVARVDPPSAEMTIDPTSACRLVDGIVVDERPLTPVGAGVAGFADVGERYQCAFSGIDPEADEDDPDRWSINVRLEVAVVDRQPDFAELADRIPVRERNLVVSSEVGPIQVASFTPDGTERSVTTAVLVVPARRGVVNLIVEELDGPSPEWTDEEIAEVLAALAT